MSASQSRNPTRPRSRGRPREFSPDQALDRAVRVFSERGYHGASISDLTRAMRLAQGSLYKAFKDKQSLFLAAFDRYRSLRSETLQRAIDNAGTGLDRLRATLAFYADSAQGAAGRQGCLVVASTVELCAFDKPVARHIAAALSRNEAFLAELIRQGQEDGSIAAHVNVEATAQLLLCLTQGMRVVGKTGRSREQMQAVVDAALKVLT
ncbi:TetR/AcrR family transcriptional regulator [Cupriavidus taiwanensis]|uniref:Putative transcriptional regulator, TetR family n=1 Tax=Cupriavidus taiwanensis TaxID=164546 RepID=A0A7Z7NL46_9BURK|nr:TetR/AcrR family transcriptional regulator [Cupriavidus taiwanensis]SOY85526.1 putative transcriptional regulator, TetR family [Cupriavidus taiwanensis]SOZ04160.1 putative transcriptional regulator, TetR family [Cupriavidus taiwanensis]SOZ07379.1 putative transcriptional regulator, TetR family [Cupriavidus taiwanensis]SPC09794.1 putative transcriptional regulator, TetR family [Cupriavidus taiwanensis]SPD39579.1 putative transcriptional regulator, TetR family [Cupriavidus taiwanensis]